MVKGISKQVIVVHPPDRELFEQAIFILNDRAEPVSDEALLRQARQAASAYVRTRTRGGRQRGFPVLPVVCALLGAFLASVLWALVLMA